MLSTIRFGRLFGNPITALAKSIAGRLRRKSSQQFHSRRPRRILRVGMLPFEEQHSVDAARMENCKAVFAYEADDGQTRTIPACLWYPYRNPILKKLSGKYGIAGKTEPAAMPATAPARAWKQESCSSAGKQKTLAGST